MKGSIGMGDLKGALGLSEDGPYRSVTIALVAGAAGLTVLVVAAWILGYDLYLPIVALVFDLIGSAELTAEEAEVSHLVVLVARPPAELRFGDRHNDSAPVIIPAAGNACHTPTGCHVVFTSCVSRMKYGL